MSSILIILTTGLLFLLGYAIYGSIIARAVKIDPNRKTPAYRLYDGVDYVPAKHWSVLFGHHFASISGAAPIIGPILAISIWGWIPAILWVVLGTIFMGGVHDFCSLMISVKHNGKTTTEITKDVISKNAKIVFMTFVWLTLILIIAVFVHICAKTFVVKPEIVIPSLGLIPVAILVGVLLYNFKLHQPSVTIIGLLFLVGLIFLGKLFPINLGTGALRIWGILLLIYAFFASVLSVNILLQPRDYLSSFLLLFGIGFGLAGLLVTHSRIELPGFHGWKGLANIQLWPILFVTVACGAISGFHSIVASGTTSKQLPSEKHAKKIGYGGMVAEGILSAMTILIIGVAFKDAAILKEGVNSVGGPVSVFGIGFSYVTKPFLGIYGGYFAMMILNAFILTTLDTATRIGRYITQELFNIKNRFIATMIVVFLAGWLGFSGEWDDIWPIFGSANQLIAALTLIVVTSWLLSRRRPVLYTLLPMLFMLATTIGALILKLQEYRESRETLLFIISAILLCLAIFIIFEAVQATIRIFRAKKHALGGV